MRRSTVTERDEAILGDLIQKWEELREMGQDTPAAELCHAYPHLAQELARRINILNVTSWLDEPLEPVTNDASPAATAPAASRTLAGRYRLDNLVAEGGFAQVWQGYDLELQRVVAVKVPQSSRLVSADAFMAEARRVARIKHPGVVQVFDVGRDGDHCFIVSEFVEGGSLGDHLVKNPPAPQQTIRWIADIAEALEHAHLHGVIHRDVKPANILIDSHNRALLGDFGIAQSANRAGKQALSLGTLRYMAPEQLEGKDLDPRSDVFSLGVVLHEALTGKVPYSSLQPNVLRREIVTGVKQVVSPTMTDDVKRVCEKALQRDPAKRQVSAAQFASELRTALVSGEPAPKPKRGLSWWIVPLCLLAVLAAGGWLLTKPLVAPASEPVLHFDGQHRIVTPLNRYLPVTLETWVRPTNGRGTEFFVSADSYGEHGIGLGINEGKLNYTFLKGANTPPYLIPLGEWSHVAAVFSENETRLYIDGKRVFTGLKSEMFGEIPFVVGGMGLDSRIYQLHGDIRSLRISDGERYSGNFTPEADLKADDKTALLYDGEHVEADRVVDQSGRGNHGTWEESIPNTPAPPLPKYGTAVP
jgi:serine/threonine protein kinase